jgi:hypothetical protein
MSYLCRYGKGSTDGVGAALKECGWVLIELEPNFNFNPDAWKMQSVTTGTANNRLYAENIPDFEVVFYVQQKIDQEIGFECSVPDTAGTPPHRIIRFLLLQELSIPSRKNL